MSSSSKYQKILFTSMAFFILLVLMAVFHENGILNAFHLEQGQDEMRSQNSNLLIENENIRAEVAALKSDPYAIEKIAREKLNLVKPGDQVYHIIQTKNPLPPPQ